MGASLNMTQWIPIVLSFSAFIKALQEYASWGRRHVAVSSAISELTKLTAFWESSSSVDKGLDTTRSFMVNTTEAAVMRVVLSQTEGRAAVQTDAGGERS